MAFIKRSMGSLMVKSPFRPRSSSARERFISAKSMFMRSLSCEDARVVLFRDVQNSNLTKLDRQKSNMMT
jgi:hypothetical protein